MATRLEKPLRCEIFVEGKAFIVTLAPDGLKLVGKGRRKGVELSWKDLVGGDAALATALRASLGATLEPARRRPAGAGRRGRRR
jgi:hypothetical protein